MKECNHATTENFIKTMDKSITDQLNKLNEFIDSLSFKDKDTCTFTLNDTIQKEDIDCQKFDYSGIYLFEIKNNNAHPDMNSWITDFTDRWGDKAGHSTPGCMKKRMDAHTELQPWIPLYLGKSRNIARRVQEHVLKELEKKTFAMKLKARQNLHNLDFRVRAIKTEVQNYDMLVPYMERRLRDKINPIVGKQ